MAREHTGSNTPSNSADADPSRSARILSLAHVGIIATDAECCATYANAAAARILGRDPEDLVGTSMLEHVAPESLEDARALIGRLELGDTLSLELPFRTRSGAVVEAVIHVVPTFDDKGGYEGAIGTIAEVSELRREARGHEERARQLEQLASTVDAVLWIAESGSSPQTTFVSPASLTLMGRSPRDLIGPPARWLSCVHTEDRHRVDAARRFVLEGHTDAFEEEYRVVLPGGEIRWLLEKAHAYREGRSAPGRVCGVATDVTESRRAQEERRRLDEKLQRKQKLESLGELAGGVAHEFNNLLLAVIGNAEMGQHIAGDNEELAPVFNEILCAGQRAALLSRQMLAYSGRGGLERRALCIGKVVANTRSMLEMAAGKGTELDVALEPTLPLVLADLEQVKQVLVNLVTNAGEALGEAGGAVRLSVGARHCRGEELENLFLGTPLNEGEYVTVEVVDDGEGMDPKTLEHLFDPFFSTRFPGRGLGMSAVLGILQGHGGGINVESRRGLGTRVELLFPVIEEGELFKRASPGKGEGLAGRKPVLLIDDEASIRELGARMLGRLGLESYCTGSGARAVELLQQDPTRFSAVILDLMMPIMSGARALERIREVAPGLPVVICSAYGRQEVAERLGELMPELVLHKPYRLEQLAAAMRKALSGSP